MKESVLNALIHLFAVVAAVNNDKLSPRAIQIVRSYLERWVMHHQLQKYLNLLKQYHRNYRQILEASGENHDPAGFMTSVTGEVCHRVSHDLNKKERLIIFLRLVVFVNEDNVITPDEELFLELVAKHFHISDRIYWSVRLFVTREDLTGCSPEYVLLYDILRGKIIRPEKAGKQDEYLAFIYVQEADVLFVKYQGKRKLSISKKPLQSGDVYLFRDGSVISFDREKTNPLYQSEVVRAFQSSYHTEKINFYAHEISYQYRSGTLGIKTFTFSETGGTLVGILGGSGSGKSTLLTMLCGKREPHSGKVYLNGYDIYKNKHRLKGLIGYVPQDDLLIEELTVYQNLLFNARLSLANLGEEEIIKRVEKVLLELNLYYVKDHQVGNALNKFISGGQRKRLNIALELIREPAVLLMDEPTTGLSSADTKNIIDLLKQLSLKGKLVIASIHQPSSDVFKRLDRVWVLDTNGYPAYIGYPVESIEYFKKISTQVDVIETECPVCGNINPDQILEIMEARKVDEEGRPTEERKISPGQWFDHFNKRIKPTIELPHKKEKLPHSSLVVPSDFKQFIILAKRNFLTKLANRQYWIINLLEPPLLAFFLAFFLKYVTEGHYLFIENRNIPVYLFSSVIVALFIGLTVSAEEIFRDRNTLERESFLFLSRPAYINSKIILLFSLSALQTLVFVLVGNSILQVKGMSIPYWVILFSVSAFGNMLGLILSSSLDSIIAIYILIPLIMVPEILFSGTMIPFDDLNEHLSNKKYTPLIGDLMTTRWAYEALAVTQFRDNRFEANLFDVERVISNNSYRTSFLLPEIKNTARYIGTNRDVDTLRPVLSHKLALIRDQFHRLVRYAGVPPFEYTDKLYLDSLREEFYDDFLGYLDFLENRFRQLTNVATERKDYILDSLARELGGNEKLLRLKQDYYNNSLANLVLNRNSFKMIVEYKGEWIRKKDPIFMNPENEWGRAQLYTSEKLLHFYYIDTYFFDLFIILFSIIFLYFLLIFDILRKMISFFRF